MGMYRETDRNGEANSRFWSQRESAYKPSILFSTSVYYNYVSFSITFFIHDVYCHSSRHTKLTVSRSGGRQIPLFREGRMFT